MSGSSFRQGLRGFALGLGAGAALAGLLLRPAVLTAVDDTDITGSIAPASAPGPLRGVVGGGPYPVDVMRIADGDSFEARVHIWPGIAITTMVRLRDIDTPELKGRCQRERDMARAAREKLAAILSEGAVEVRSVGLDKFGGRIDANVATRSTPDVAGALLRAGFGRDYAGGRREGWCS